MIDFANIPNVDHYAIIEREVVHIPGDERSRTHPGHGYPAEDREYVTYKVYRKNEREAWVRHIQTLTERRKDFKALHVYPATVETKVSVSIKTDRDA